MLLCLYVINLLRSKALINHSIWMKNVTVFVFDQGMCVCMLLALSYGLATGFLHVVFNQVTVLSYETVTMEISNMWVGQWWSFFWGGWGEGEEGRSSNWTEVVLSCFCCYRWKKKGFWNLGVVLRGYRFNIKGLPLFIYFFFPGLDHF